MDEKFKLAGNRRMCGIANDVSRPIVLNDMHDRAVARSENPGGASSTGWG